MEIFYPIGLESYDEYFKTVLSVAGVLFGLAFAALLFVIQSGFASFKYSRRMFLELYVHFGSGLLISLAYLTLMPFLVLYVKNNWWMVNLTYLIFTFFYTKSYLSHKSHMGYIHTINSNKFVPESYGKLRRYFRYITNLGLFHTLFIFSVLFILFGYPVIVTYLDTGGFSISEKAVFYSTLFILILSIVKITNFIPEFFNLSNQELDSKNNVLNEDGDPNINCKIEKDAFEKYLVSHGLTEVNIFDKVNFLDGDLWLEILKTEKPEIWCNVHISVSDTTNVEIKNEVCSYALRLIEVFSLSQVDVNSLALSFHISIEGDKKSTRNIFLRVKRNELNNIEVSSSQPIQEINKLDNVLFDELFRGL